MTEHDTPTPLTEELQALMLEAKLRALEQFADKLPPPKLIEHEDGEPSWEEDLSDIDSMYREGSAIIVERRAKILISFIQAKVSEVGDGITPEDVLSAEDLVDIENGKGELFPYVRVMAMRHGVGVDELYEKFFPRPEQADEREAESRMTRLRQAIGARLGR